MEGPKSESISLNKSNLLENLQVFPWKIVWIAFAIRVLYLTIAHTYRFKTFPWPHHFQFGWEMGQIAASLAEGHGYSNPFCWGPSGPTSWTTPLFPLLLAGVFKLFGSFSFLSAWIILTINSLFSALSIRPLWEIARRCFNPKVALWSAWIWALHPAAMQYAIRWVWEMSLTLLLFQWILVLTLRMGRVGGDESGPSTRRWLLFGGLWGLIALSNPSLILFLPVNGLWILTRGEWKRQVLRAIAGAVLCIAVIAPWTWRNWLAFHQFVPLRANFGVELYLGNDATSEGLLHEYNHPNEALDQFQLYKEMGEVDYAKQRGELAKTIIRQDPQRFVRNTLRRIYFFWAGTPHPDASLLVEGGRNLNFCFGSVVGVLGLGLALKRKIPAATLFAFAFLLLPLVYYVVTVHARFRHPLEPLIVILGVHLFQAATSKASATEKVSLS